MESLYIIAGVVIYMLGIITGIYWSSQIEKDIDKRIKK